MVLAEGLALNEIVHALVFPWHMPVSSLHGVKLKGTYSTTSSGAGAAGSAKVRVLCVPLRLFGSRSLSSAKYIIGMIF